MRFNSLWQAKNMYVGVRLLSMNDVKQFRSYETLKSCACVVSSKWSQTPLSENPHVGIPEYCRTKLTV